MRAHQGLTLSLRHLLILLTAIGLLPLALLGVWSIHAAGQYQQREHERAMLDITRALSSAVDAELEGSVAALTSMARTPAMVEGDIRAFYDVAREQAQAQPEWLGVVLTDADGRMLFRTTAAFGAPPAAVADPASLQQVLSVRRPVVGQVTRGTGGRPAVPVRIPVTDRKGGLYTLTAVIRPDRIMRVIQRQRVPEGSLISIMDGSGSIVARSKDQLRSVGRQASASLVELMRRAGPESVGNTRTIEGDEVVTAYTRLSRYGWTVAIGAPTAAFRAALLEGFALYGAGIAASLLVCIGIASLLSARIVETIRHLQVGASALGAGAPLSVPPSRIKEMQLMGQALEAAALQRTAHEQERSLLLASLERALEKQEQALAQARDAGRAKDEFLAVLGHELRNPLSPIVTSLDLMDMRNEGGSLRERSIMRRQVNHLKRLVDDLLDVSRITSGKFQLDLRPVNFADVVRHAVAALRDPRLVVSAPEAVWVRGDDSRLAQVLNNLLSNATRFGSDRTTVSLAAADGFARLVVSDSGAGMSPELLAQVFEPFFQAPQQAARPTGGLGLGLAIVRKIVELHGGHVSAHSAGAGKGSRFEVLLPLGSAAPSEAPAGSQAAPAGLRVLLVDDNEDAALSTAVLLEHLGYEVRVAHTAQAALRVFKEYAPDVAILDIGLPDMDGYALAAAIRQTAAGSRARLVALTGYGQKGDIERATEAGFDLHLTKPATVDDLRRAMAPAELADRQA
jgi:signal transduction histidine kinase/ActR/RegA family two-component response regulator